MTKVKPKTSEAEQDLARFNENIENLKVILGAIKTDKKKESA